MTIVESDGNYIEPITVKNLNIYSGETYSVLVKADQDASRNYWAATNVVSRERKTPPGLTIFNYYPNQPTRQPSTIPPSGPAWNDTNYRMAQSQALRALQGHVPPPPPTTDETLIFLGTQNHIDGYVRWSINNISFTQPKTPYLIAIKNNLTNQFDQNPPPKTYDYANYDIYIPNPNPNSTYSNAIYRLKFNSTVDVILQNANMMKPNNSETHPWHLHGHDFWVLGYGNGKYDPKRDPQKYNFVNAIVKNTVPLHPYGWTAIRFVSDNPGVWAFHCHIDPHFYLGMGVVFESGMDYVGELPDSIMGCGEAKG